MRTRLLIVAALACVVTLAHAFEPGHDRICTASADGQTFECRDKATAAIDTPQAKPAEPATVAEKSRTASAAPKQSPTATTAASSAPKPAANKLPNYLMQNPSPAQPERDVELRPAVVRQPTSIEPRAGNAQAAAASASTAETHALSTQPADTRPALSTEEVAAHPQQAAAAPAPAPHPSAAPIAPVRDVPRAMPEPEPRAASPTVLRPEITGLPGASAFLALPESHYTLVLASVRDASALDDLIKALEAQAGQLYLLKLRMPDGDWYSLCWSDFADLDGARAARASLPADAPISSGWPRRIGLLQKEIAR